jgi:hypothetical protein
MLRIGDKGEKIEKKIIVKMRDGNKDNEFNI